ncbi:MAG: SPOR domain-containing protein [Gloeomargarita sp. SKYBB_i_bin120]|nr:SPOR domain-containing protein [Gloeomargarita sp. SKYG98]MCS7293184.1 SPOR domain-containing protein [Gloeomargarita sp. SKYB120]MDW8178749.1 SPOR domain-containing protein [Gloeomargarita sp. SKYBB_i_bin120]
MTEQSPPTSLLTALACLDVDLTQELQRWRAERPQWTPEVWARWQAEHPTPPPETAWAFPPAVSADPPTALAAEDDSQAVAPLTTPPPETDSASPAVEDTTELAPRPSWSERLNRVFVRRQAQENQPAPEAWAFPESWYQPTRHRGVPQSLLGFVIGLTLATVGTVGVLLVVRRPPSPEPTTSPLSVPAPPPEHAVLPSPVPNLARKELPDLSAVPTVSPPATPKAPTNPSLYYVVTDYQNEQSLLRAQRVVPEAFVWQFDTGLKVQLGAFETRDQAEAFVADLKAKGLQAQVYP